jgi:hypothetical protein
MNTTTAATTTTTTLTTTTSTTTTTTTTTVKTFLNQISSQTFRSSISSFSGGPSFVCLNAWTLDSSKTYIYIVDYTNGNIIKCDTNWNYISYVGGFSSPTYIISVGTQFVITGTDIVLTNNNLATTATYSASGRFRGLTYNPTTSMCRMNK